MAAAEINCKVDISSIQPVNSILHLLADNWDDLPEPVKVGIEAISDDSGLGAVVECDDLKAMLDGEGYSGLMPSFGELDNRLTKVDRLRRKAVFVSDNGAHIEKSAESLSMVTDTGREIKLW